MVMATGDMMVLMMIGFKNKEDWAGERGLYTKGDTKNTVL